MKSAERALDVLDLLSRQPTALDAATISRLCSIPRSSTYQLLRALKLRGVVASDEHGRWSTAPQLRQMASDSPSLAEMMRVLDAFQRGSERVDAGELARRSLLHLATVDQILPLLAAQDLVVAHDDRTYSLGLRVAIMAARFGELEQLRATARPVLSQLRDDTGETANLVIRDGGHAVYIEQAQSPRALRHVGWIGRRIPLEVSATGRAFRDGRRSQTVRDSVEEGVTAVASRVMGLTEHDAAISVTGPTTRLKGETLRSAKHLVIAASAEISHKLARLR